MKWVTSVYDFVLSKKRTILLATIGTGSLLILEGFLTSGQRKELSVQQKAMRAEKRKSKKK